MNKLSHSIEAVKVFGKSMEGRILPPLILWMLGVPGGIVLILWFFFFRG